MRHIKSVFYLILSKRIFNGCCAIDLIERKCKNNSYSYNFLLTQAVFFFKENKPEYMQE